MRYPYGGGLTAEGRSRREMVRWQAARMFEQGMNPVQAPGLLRVSAKSANQWRRAWKSGGEAAWHLKALAGVPASWMTTNSPTGGAPRWTPTRPSTSGKRTSSGRWPEWRTWSAGSSACAIRCAGVIPALPQRVHPGGARAPRRRAGRSRDLRVACRDVAEGTRPAALLCLLPSHQSEVRRNLAFGHEDR